MKLLKTGLLAPLFLLLGATFILGGCDRIGLIDPGHGGGGHDAPAKISALHFDGNDYVRVKNSRDLQLSGLKGFTIDAWVRSDSWSHWNWIATHARSNKNNDFLFGFDGGRLRFITNNLANDLMGSTRLETGKWHHVAGVLDRSDGSMKIYVNGKFEGERRLVRGSETTTADLFIGARESFGTDRPTEFFDGLIHEVRIFGTALSGEQVKRVMKQRNPRLDLEDDEDDPDRYRKVSAATPKSLFIARWPMNEGQGSVVQDLSGHNHHGRIHGATWVKAINPMK